MDVAWFLKERTAFLRFFYETGAQPFLDIKQKIEDEVEPFEQPYDEDGDEPAFQIEYQQAWTGIEMVGIATLSMLSDSLKVFFSTWEQLLGLKFPPDWQKRFRKEGFVRVYHDAFGQITGEDWASCPANLDVIEQVVMARNDAQHGEHLHAIQPRHKASTRAKHPRPFFVSDIDKMIINTEALSDFARTGLQISVTKEGLFSAIEEIEKLADWMELRLQAVRWPSGEEAQKLAAMRAEGDAQ